MGKFARQYDTDGDGEFCDKNLLCLASMDVVYLSLKKANVRIIVVVVVVVGMVDGVNSDRRQLDHFGRDDDKGASCGRDTLG